MVRSAPSEIDVGDPQRELIVARFVATAYRDAPLTRTIGQLVNRSA